MAAFSTLTVSTSDIVAGQTIDAVLMCTRFDDIESVIDEITNASTGAAKLSEDVTFAKTLAVTGVATLAKGALLGSADAPTSDAMIANKKYVDGKTGAVGSVTPATVISTTDSIVFANGLIVKFGLSASLTTNNDWNDIEYPVAFPGGCLAVFFSQSSGSSDDKHDLVRKKSGAETTHLQVFNGDLSADITGYWLAIGY